MSREDRVVRAVVFASWAFYALVTAWELFGVLPGGHLGNATGAAIAAENMLHHRFLGAVLEYTQARPTAAQHYTHHPYGVFVTSALFHAIFGHGFHTVRLTGVVFSLACPPLLWLFARSLFGELAAAVASVVFVVLPVNLAYGTFHNLETQVMLWGLLFSWSTARFYETGARRWAVVSVVGGVLACHADWIGFVLVGLVGAAGFVHSHVVPRRLAAVVEPERRASWFAWLTLAATASLLFYVVHVGKLGQLGELFSSYEHRSQGSGAPLGQVFGPRRLMWLLWMLPAPGLLGLVAGSAVALFRTFRRASEWIVVAWTLASLVQYFGFRNGADVHVFWPHMAAVPTALGFAVVGASLHEAVSAYGRRSWAAVIAVAPAVLAALLLLRVGLPIARQSRLTGGRFDDGGRYIGVDQDRHVFAGWAATRAGERGELALHRSFARSWGVEYAIGKPLGSPGTHLLADARYLSSGELDLLAKGQAVEVVGPFLLVTRGKPPSFTALRFDERQPGLFERYWRTGSDLVFRVADVDPFLTHEWRDHLGLETKLPATPPRAPDEARIAWNASRDAALRPLAERVITTRMDVAFTGGVKLVGLDVERGPATVFTLLWETSDDFVASDADFLVRSRVVAPPFAWPSRIDHFEKELAPPMALRPSLWKPGRLYVQRFVAMKRIGDEDVWGVWTVRKGGEPRVPVGRAAPELALLRY